MGGAREIFQARQRSVLRSARCRRSISSLCTPRCRALSPAPHACRRPDQVRCSHRAGVIRTWLRGQSLAFLVFLRLDYIRWFRDSRGIRNSSRSRRHMTLLDVVFKYGTPPGEREMMALNNAWEVYGVRKIKFDEKEKTIRVAYHSTRLNDE